jgi:DNA-3-methyladenine glycosylase
MNSSFVLLQRGFYERPTPEVAQDLLGKLLVRRLGGTILVTRIVETEAYLGSNDPAAHAAAGKTKRTEVLFGHPGHAYVYRIHQHHCLNIVVEPEHSPGCVLIRAVEPLSGIEIMLQHRTVPKSKITSITSGPGKLCQALGIDISLYGTDVTTADSSLFISEAVATDFLVKTTPRVGISKAKDALLRFYIDGNEFVSR